MIREVTSHDLAGLLQLYTQLHDNPMPEDTEETKERLQALWTKILEDTNHHVIVAEEDDRIVSSCVCVVVPNLTREQRPYGFIENVVTAKEYRGRGLATACLNYARELAKKEKCYKLMLMTGSKQDETLRFYERAGYNRNDKTAFIQWL